MKNRYTMGPCETLARLAIQSDRYAQEPEFKVAVDNVLGHTEFDAAPNLLEVCKKASKFLDSKYPTQDQEDLKEIIDDAIRKAEQGE